MDYTNIKYYFLILHPNEREQEELSYRCIVNKNDAIAAYHFYLLCGSELNKTTDLNI